MSESHWTKVGNPSSDPSSSLLERIWYGEDFKGRERSKSDFEGFAAEDPVGTQSRKHESEIDSLEAYNPWKAPPSLNTLDLRAIQRHRGDGRAEQRDKIRHGTKAILLPDEFHSRWVNRTKCPVQLPAQLHWAFWNYCYKNLNFANIFLVRETTFFSDFIVYINI